jgi:hypothetical protein
MLDCVVYFSSVANIRKEKNIRKLSCLQSFATGVATAGHKVQVETDYVYTPSRLAVILAWATTNTGGQNITLRKQIIAEQQRQGLRTMCIDASCWKYIDNSSIYLRYSLDGPFYDRAEYANRNSDSSKWLQIKQTLGIELHPIKSSNNHGHIVICMQRDGGFAMKELSPMIWLEEKIKQIRMYSNRTILIRPHPGAYKPEDFVNYRKEWRRIYNVHILDPNATSLIENLNGAHAAVFFNSSASVAAVCAGIPVFVDDQSCVSWDVANKDISKIETPEMFEREQWLYDLSNAHWSDTESQQGLIYQKFLPHIS